MKIHTDLRAGMTFTQCNNQRNWYKNHVRAGSCSGEANPLPGACTKVFTSTGQCLYKNCPYPPFKLPC